MEISNLIASALVAYLVTIYFIERVRKMDEQFMKELSQISDEAIRNIANKN